MTVAARTTRSQHGEIRRGAARTRAPPLHHIRARRKRPYSSSALEDRVRAPPYAAERRLPVHPGRRQQRGLLDSGPRTHLRITIGGMELRTASPRFAPGRGRLDKLVQTVQRGWTGVECVGHPGTVGARPSRTWAAYDSEDRRDAGELAMPPAPR